MKKNFKYISVASFIVALSSCSYQSNNSITQNDPGKDNQWVYGVSPDSGAAQLKITYTAKPELEAEATKIKEKLYGFSAVPATAAADTTTK